MALIAPQIERVRVLGVRTAEQTKVLATYNSSVYCLLILYTNGNRELVEVPAEKMKKYLQYIKI